MRPWINYHHLLYFKTIALEGGIANAAKKLRLGQPTLSTQLKQFETTLGHALFDRSKRQLQLTEAGRLVLGYATEIFRLGDEMLDALSDRHVGQKIQVQIGVADAVPKHITLDLFHSAQSKQDCIVTLAEGHTHELLRELRAHRIDLVLSNDPPHAGDGGGIYAKNIARVPAVAVGAKKYGPLAKNFPASLNQQPVILPSIQSKLRHAIDHYFELNGVSPDVVAEVQDTSLQKLMAAHGDGIIILAAPAATELIGNRSLVEIGTMTDVYDELWLFAGKRRLENPVAAQLMKEFTL